MEEKKDKKKILVIASIVAILVIAIGATYAFYTYSNTGLESKLIAGEMYMKYQEGSALNISGLMPSSDYPTSSSGNYFQFQITGKNTHTTKDITYNLKLAHGNVPSGKSESNRIDDQYLLFKLVEVDDNTETAVVTDANYDTIPGALLYSTTVPHNTTNVMTKTYRLYARISEEVGIGNGPGAIYSISGWNNLFASIMINAEGSLSDAIVQPALPGAEQIISTYGTENAGGLIGINKNGGLYNPNATGADANDLVIREYRYSGNSVPIVGETSPEESTSQMKNYIYFNGNELWRIVGIFDSDDNLSNGCQNCRMKIVRNDPLSNVPLTYTNLSNKEFQLNYYGDNTDYPKQYSQVSWNLDSDSNFSTNWNQAGLMYYLNEGKTGSYYSSIDGNYQTFIDNTTYYLGNVSHYGYNPQEYYLDERDTSSSNVYEGNSSTWAGKIGLLYPSDYVYSFPSGDWNDDFQDKDNWLNGANMYGWRVEWFLSPDAVSSNVVMRWYSIGIGSDSAGTNDAVRPVLNLKSDTVIVSGDGSYNNPYRIIAES